MERVPGSFIEEGEELAPNLGDEAMAARQAAEKTPVPDAGTKSKSREVKRDA